MRGSTKWGTCDRRKVSKTLALSWRVSISKSVTDGWGTLKNISLRSVSCGNKRASLAIDWDPISSLQNVSEWKCCRAIKRPACSILSPVCPIAPSKIDVRPLSYSEQPSRINSWRCLVSTSLDEIRYSLRAVAWTCEITSLERLKQFYKMLIRLVFTTLGVSDL